MWIRRPHIYVCACSCVVVVGGGGGGAVGTTAAVNESIIDQSISRLDRSSVVSLSLRLSPQSHAAWLSIHPSIQTLCLKPPPQYHQRKTHTHGHTAPTAKKTHSRSTEITHHIPGRDAACALKVVALPRPNAVRHMGYAPVTQRIQAAGSNHHDTH